MTVRAAAAADIPSIAPLAAITSTTVELDVELQRNFSRVWLKELDQAPAAYLLAWHVADELQILDIATHEHSRRRGAATALLKHALDYCHREGLARALLEVRADSDGAVSLYKRLGWKVQRRRSRYYGDGSDALEMELSL